MLEEQTRICCELVNHVFILILVAGSLMCKRTCAQNKLEVHGSGATHRSTCCCTTGSLLLSLLPSLPEHELLESGGEYLLRREKWVGRDCEEKRGGGCWIYQCLPAEALAWSHCGWLCASASPFL